MKNVINIHDLNVTFNAGTVLEHKALNQFNLSVNKGEFVVLLGSNGAGKSTLLKAISGEISLAKGMIYIDGHDISALSKYKRAKDISRISQDPLLGTFSDLTIEENLSLAHKRGKVRNLKLALSKGQQQSYVELLNLLDLNLERKIRCKMGSLSGGQRQAICLLMATLQDAKVLLLDEHTAALDPRMSKHIMELTSAFIKEKELTVLMVTHDLSQALQYGSRIIVMKEGRIIKDYQKNQNLSLNQLNETLYE